MSDTGDSTTKIGIDASVTGKGEVAGLTAEVAGLSQHLANLSAAALKNFNTQEQLNKALDTTRRSTGVLSQSFNQYRTNLSLVQKTITETTKRLDALTVAQNRAAAAGAMTPQTLAGYNQTRMHLNAVNDSMGAVTKVMRGNAVEQFGMKMKQAGQTAQRSAYYMTAATMPMLLAFKAAFFNFTKLEQEQVRLRKLIGDNFEGMANGAQLLADELKIIDTALDGITRKFGTSRVLIQSLAGDFAELGVPSDAVIRLTEFTAAAEKLGNLDISSSQNFIQSLYQNIVRVRRDMAQNAGMTFDITNAKELTSILDEVQGQLALFNLIENKTSLSLKDIADAFPEVSAAATTFGLSMTETAALLTPMVAAGFQVGASANSIKVSLQRLVSLTKQNASIIKQLNSEIGGDFNMAADVGMESIQRLVDGYSQLKKSKGEQGALEFFSRLFGVRQGPRMEVAISQMAAFQTALQTAGSSEAQIAKTLEETVNLRLRQAGMEEISLNKVIDLTNLHRSAIEEANGEYTLRADIIQGAQKEASDLLKKEFAGTSDYLAKVGTETGREIFMQSIGGVAAANATMQAELAMAISTTATNFNRLRESMLSIGRQLVPVVGGVISKILPVIQKIEEFVTNMSPAIKKLIGGFLLFVIIIPQIRMLFAIFKMGFGWVAAFFGKAILGSNSLIKNLTGVASKMVNIQDLVNNPKLAKGFNKMTEIGDKMLLQQDPNASGYGRGILQRRKMMPTGDNIRISAAMKELFEGGSLRASTSLASAKAMTSRVEKTGLSGPLALIKSMLGIPEKISKSVEKAAEKTAKTTTEKLAKALKGSIFQNNTFLGNKFGGNVAGPGGSGPGGTGSGPRTPKTPKVGGTPADTRPTYGPKLPSFVTPGVSKGVTFADLAKLPKPAPTGAAGPAIASIFAGITAAIGGMGGAPAAPTGASTAPARPSLPVIKPSSTKGKTKVLRDLATALAAHTARAQEELAALAKIPEVIGAKVEEQLNDVKKAATKGARAPPKPFFPTADGKPIPKAPLLPKAPITPKPGDAAIKSLNKVKKAVTISYKEIKDFFDQAGVAIPKEYEFIRSVNREVVTNERAKKEFFNNLKKQFDKKAENPFGKIKKVGPRGKLFPFNAQRALTKSSQPHFDIFRNLLGDMSNTKVNPGLGSQMSPSAKNNLLHVVAGMREAEGAKPKTLPTLKPISKSEMKKATKAAEVARAARRVTEAVTETPLYPPKGVETVYRPAKTKIQIEEMKKHLSNAQSELAQIEKQLKDFTDVVAKAPEKLKKAFQIQRKAVERMQKELTAAHQLPRTLTGLPNAVIPASAATSELLNLQQSEFPGSSIAQNVPGKDKDDYSRNLTNLVKNLGSDSPNLKTKVLYDLLLEENVQKIMSTTDQVVKDKIEQEARQMLQQDKVGNKSSAEVKKLLEAHRKTTIANMAERQTNMSSVNPMSLDYDPEKEKSLFANKKVVEQVRKKYASAKGGGQALVKELTAMEKDMSPAKIKFRKKAADAWRKTGFALRQAEEVAAKRAYDIANAIARATTIPSASSVRPIAGGLPSMDPYASGPTSRPGLKMPAIIRKNIAFATKGGGAIVTEAMKTYEDLVKSTIENISKNLPASLGAHKKMLINDISNALLRTQPLGVGKASQLSLKLLKMPIDPSTIKRVESALIATTNTILQDYNAAIAQGATYATMSGQKASRSAGRNALTFFKGALNKFVKNGDDLSKALSGIVTDMIAASSVGINDLEKKGVLGAGSKAPKVKAALLGKDGLISRLQRQRAGEKGLLSPAIPFDSEPKPRSVEAKKVAVIESTVATKEEAAAAAALAKAEEAKTAAVTASTAGTKTETAATTASTVAKEGETAATVSSTAGTKAKAVATAASVKSSTIDSKITDLLGVKKVAQLAAIDLQIASLTAEQIASDAGQAVINQRNEVTTKLNSLAKAQAEVVKAQANADAAGRKTTTHLTDTKRDLNKKLENAKTETDKLARKTKSLTDSMKPAKAMPAVDPVSADTGKAPSGARSPKTIVAPKGGSAATTAATAAGSGMGGVIKKLDEVAISFDKSLANFFKGPNFFQGPNIFQGKIISADKLKITMTDRVRDASRLAKARAALIPADDPLVARAKRRAALAAVRKSILDKPGASIDSERAAKLRRIVGIDPRKTVKIPAGPAVSSVASPISTTVKATRTTMGKITDVIKSGISKGFHAGSKLGMTAVEKFVKMYVNAFKSAGKAGADAMSQILVAIGAIFGKTIAADAATGKLASAYKFLTKVSGNLGKSLKSNLIESIFLMRMLGTAIRQDVGTAVAQLMASLSNSRVIKIWSFLLFAGMNKFYKILKTTLVSMSLFSGHGARMAVVSKSLEAVSKMRVAAGMSETIPMISRLVISTFSYLGIVRGLRGAFQALLKTMTTALAIGIKLNATLMLVAPVLLLITGLVMTMRTGLGNSAPALKNFKEAWILIKEAIVKLSQPFMALINKFGNIGKAASGAEEASGALYNISRAVKFVATAFNNFARSTGMRFINNVIIPVLTRVINRFILLGRAIKGAFKNDGTAASNFKGFLLSLAYEVVSIMQKIFAFLAVVSAALGPVLVKMIEAVANATIDAFMYIMNFGKEVALFFGSMLVGIGGVTTLLGGAGLPILGFGAGLLAAAGAATLLEKNIGKVKNKVGEASTFIGIGMAQGMARGARYMEREFLGSIKASIAKKYGEEIGADVNAALAVQVGDPKDVKKALADVLDKGVKNPTAAKAAGESLAKNIAKGIKDKLISLKEDFTSSFFSKADDQISKIVDKYKEAIDAQKEEALKAFDTQISAIEALADAEEELTATMEYEQKRREMILAKSLDKQNYLRERKIAKYEGRTEDVRSMDLAFRKTDKDSTKEIKDLDTDRTKTLQEKQRSIAIAVINREKEVMSKTFEEMQKQFDSNIEKILNKGFSTKEEFTALLGEIADAGTGFSSDINGVFVAAMNSLPAAIGAVTDPSIGMFSMTMSSLVDQAKNSFGAEFGTANATSILGAAYFMAKGMPDAFKTAFNDGIIAQSVTPFIKKVTDIFDKASGVLNIGLGPTNIDELWIEAGRSAIEAMIAEMKRKLIGLKGTLYDEFKTMFAGMAADYQNLFPELERLAKEIARIEAIRGAADGGGGSDPEKSKPSVGGAAGKYFVDPKSGEHLARRPLAGITGPLAPGEKDSSFFGGIIDGAKKLVDILGPVKTAILGAVGVIAGLGVLKVIFGAIATGFSYMGAAIETAKIAIFLFGTSTGAMVAGIVGIIVGVFIYMYLKFESFRNMVNDTFSKLFNFLKDGFNALKKPVMDLGFAIFDGIKSILISVFGPIVKAIGGIIAGVIWVFMGALAVIATVLDKIKKPVFDVIAFIINLATSVVKIITAIITTTFDTFYGAIGGTVKIIGAVFVVLFNIFKSVFGAILDFAKGPFDWLSINVPKILEPISKVFEKIKDVASNVFNTIKDSVVNVLTIIKDKFDLFGIKFKTIGDVLLAPFGLLFKIVKDNLDPIVSFVKRTFELIVENIKKAFDPLVGILSTIGSFILSLLIAPFKILFELIKKIIQNPVVDFFLRLVAMLGLLAAMLATWGVKIALETTWRLIKEVVGALKGLAEFILGGISAAFNFMKDLIIGVWDAIYSKVKTFIDWWHENVGSLWLLLIAGVVLAYEGIKVLFDWLGSAFTVIWDVIKKAASLCWDAIKLYVETWWAVIKTVAGWLGTVFTIIWDVVKKAASLCWDAIKLYVEVWWEIIKKVAGWLGTAFTVIWDVIKKAASLYWDYLKFAVSTWWDVIKTVAGWLGTVFTAVWGVIKIAASAIWDYLSNIVPRTWDNLKQIANWISTAFVAVWDGLKIAVGFVWDLIKAGWDFIGPILGEFIDRMKNGLLFYWDLLKQGIGFVWDVIKTGWNFISPLLGKFINLLKDSLLFYWNLLKIGIDFVWDAIKTGWGFISPVLNLFADIIGNVLSKYWDLLKKGINFVWDAIKAGWSFVGPILGFFGDVIKNVIGFAIENLKKVWDKFVDAIKFAKDIIVTILQTIGGFIASAIGFAIENVVKVWNGLKTAFQNVWDTVKPIISFIGDAIKTVIGGAIDLVVSGIKLIPDTFKLIVNGVSGLFNKLVDGLGNFGFPKTILGFPLPFGLGGKKVSDFITLPKLPQLYNGGKVGSYMSGGMAYMKGGMMYGAGGMTYGPAQQGIPAILHGGEYVINHKAVQRIGTDVLDRMNSLRMSKPNLPTMPSVPNINMSNMRVSNTVGGGRESSSTQNVNIYVDNFIGEPEWFTTMMKKYNTTVLPRNQKAAGLENRVINSYKGIAKGN